MTILDITIGAFAIIITAAIILVSVMGLFAIFCDNKMNGDDEQ